MTLEASLSEAEGERDRLRGLLDRPSDAAKPRPGNGHRARRGARRGEAHQVSPRALAQVELLNQQISALRRQMTAVEEDASARPRAGTARSQTNIADLGGA